jgi:hypothetical protein
MFASEKVFKRKWNRNYSAVQNPTEGMLMQIKMGNYIYGQQQGGRNKTTKANVSPSTTKNRCALHSLISRFQFALSNYRLVAHNGT